jgi:CheY-like chemotaxis protein
MKEIRTVLIVEDEPLNLELEKALFKAASYTVLEAGNAKEGIAIAQDKKPDVIIVDYQMPKIDGAQFIKMLKQDQRTQGIPCIIVTASTTEEERKKLKSSEACGYITKPINTRTFVKQVIELARKRPAH